MEKPRMYEETPPVKSRKQKYDVFDVFSGEYVGSAVAVSEAQACNLVRYRSRDNERPNGGYKEDNPLYAMPVNQQNKQKEITG